MATTQLSPADRAQAFARLTRKQTTMLPPVAGAVNSRVTLDLPKVRLGQKLYVEITADLEATHATATSYDPAPFAPFTLLDHIKVSLNNGWHPVDLSGKGLYLWNLVNSDTVKLARAASGRGPVVQGVTASATGTTNNIKFLVEIPFMLNERDVIGLLMLQNQQTLVTVNIDFADAAALHDGTANFTYVLSNIVVTPMITTFSLPADQQYWPDVSIIKITEEWSHAIAGAGNQSLKIPCGNMYRKLLLYIEDAAGGEADADIAGNFGLYINSNDLYREIKPSILAAENAKQFNGPLPQGVFVFDLSDQGQPNYGGSRDYIDTEKLTQFDFRFTAAGAGNVLIIGEQLARLS
jgi:hypothetical protein